MLVCCLFRRNLEETHHQPSKQTIYNSTRLHWVPLLPSQTRSLKQQAQAHHNQTAEGLDCCIIVPSIQYLNDLFFYFNYMASILIITAYKTALDPAHPISLHDALNVTAANSITNMPIYLNMTLYEPFIIIFLFID